MMRTLLAAMLVVLALTGPAVVMAETDAERAATAQAAVDKAKANAAAAEAKAREDAAAEELKRVVPADGQGAPPSGPEGQSGSSTVQLPTTASAEPPAPAEGGGVDWGWLLVSWFVSTICGALGGAALAVRTLRKEFRNIVEQVENLGRKPAAQTLERDGQRDAGQQHGSGWQTLSEPPPATGAHHGRSDVAKKPIYPEQTPATGGYVEADRGASEPPPAVPRPAQLPTRSQALAATLTGLLAQQSLGRDEYEQALAAFGPLHDVAAVRNGVVEISGGYGGPQQRLIAVSIDLDRTMALVPSYDFISDFRTVYSQTLDLPEIVKATFDTEIDHSRVLKVSRPAIVRNAALISRGIMAGFIS